MHRDLISLLILAVVLFYGLAFATVLISKYILVYIFAAVVIVVLLRRYFCSRKDKDNNT